MELVILVLFVALPGAAFHFVRTRRTGWGWAMPLLALGLGALGVAYVDTVAVSEQSRGFGSIVILFLFVLMAVFAAIGCIIGHIVRRAEARQGYGA